MRIARQEADFFVGFIRGLNLGSQVETVLVDTLNDHVEANDSQGNVAAFVDILTATGFGLTAESFFEDALDSGVLDLRRVNPNTAFVPRDLNEVLDEVLNPDPAQTPSLAHLPLAEELGDMASPAQVDTLSTEMFHEFGDLGLLTEQGWLHSSDPESSYVMDARLVGGPGFGAFFDFLF